MNELFAGIVRFFQEFVVWVTVQPWEQAIRVRAGRHVRRLPPGFHFRLPILDVVHKQSVRRRIALVSTQTLSTSDGHTVTVASAAGYEIADIEKLYRGLHHAQDTIMQIVASRIAEVVQATARTDLVPEKLSAEAAARLSDELVQYGISNVTLALTDFAFVRAFRLIQDQRWGHGRGLRVEGKEE